MITLDGPNIIIDMPNSAGLKKELGARSTKNGTLSLPATSLNVLRLVEMYGKDTILGADPIIDALANEEFGFDRFDDEERERAAKHPAWEKLYDFQREGVEYLSCNPHAAGLCALSPGLGKAAVSIVASEITSLDRVLVLAPLTLARNWTRELDIWAADPPQIKRATADDRSPGDAGWTIANHEVIQEVVLRDEDGVVSQPDWATNAKIVKEWRESGPTKIDPKGKKVPARERIVRLRRDYAEVDWDLIIIDESVLLKNRKALKTEILMSLRKAGDPFVWELSGSPTTKHNDDLYRQLQILYPKAFASYWRFAEFFCYVDKDGWGWTIEGDRPDRDPHHYLRDFLFVRSQEDVLPELPDYIVKPVAVEASKRQRKALDSMINDWIVELDDADEPVVAANWLSRSTRLQQITSNLGALPKADGTFHKPDSAKARVLMDLIRQEEIETPLLVWTWFIESTELLLETFAKTFPDLKVGAVHGKMPRGVKDSTFDAYEAGELDVLICQLGVGKHGHTMTNTKTVFYHDRTFDSDAWVQSLRRVRRIGLKHKPVLIVPEIDESADQLIAANLEGKLPSIAKLTNSDLASFLRSLGKED